MIRHQTTLVDALLGQLSRCFAAESARQVVEIRVDPAVRLRIEALAERQDEGLLSAEERSEYMTLVNASDFITALQHMARRHLTANID